MIAARVEASMYRERTPISILQPHVVCVWRHRQTDAARHRTVTVVPDGCIDIVWTSRELRVAGPDTRPVTETIHGAAEVVGVRCHTGRANGVLGVPASALRDARVPLDELWGDAAGRLRDALLEASGDQALRVLQEFLATRRVAWAPPDPLVTTLVARLRLAPAEPDLRMAALARELGVSERQLHRRCSAAVGYGPKLLARVLRMERVRTALRTGQWPSLAALATGLGFADQAHLAHEAAQLYATTPGRMRAEAASHAAASDSDKTADRPARQAPAHELATSASRRR
jgi:AraC-like DNA-binding protein